MRREGGLPWLRFVVVGALVALDLWSKEAVFSFLESRPEGLVMDHHLHSRYPVLGEWLALHLRTNNGMAFGLLEDYPWALVVGRLLAVTVLGVLLWRCERRRWVLNTALVLVMAGALGNLHDNLFREGEPFGAVRDFIDVYFAAWDYHFYTFNVADACISVGAVLLLLSSGSAAEEEEEERLSVGAAGGTGATGATGVAGEEKAG